MAKIRVHELAKELNMTNKAILTKLKAMNIEVKSHMSSLEDETVEYIRLNIFGNKQKDNNSKTSTSVIRRRKKNTNEELSPASHPEIRRSEHQLSDKAYKASGRDGNKYQISVKPKAFEQSDKSIQKHLIKDRGDYSDLDKNSDINKKEYKVEDNYVEKNSEQDNSGENNITKKDNLIVNQSQSVEHGEQFIEKVLPTAQNTYQIEFNNLVENTKSDSKTTYSMYEDNSDNTTIAPISPLKDKAKEIYSSKYHEKEDNFNFKESFTSTIDSKKDSLEKEIKTTEQKKDELFGQEQQSENQEEIKKNYREELQKEELQNDYKSEFEVPADLAEQEYQDNPEEESNDLLYSGDRKKKKKKKQKKSEPAKIIKLAITTPLLSPKVVAPSIKKREYPDKTSGINPSSDKGLPHKERSVYDKNRFGIEKDKTIDRLTERELTQFSDRDKTPFNRDNRGDRKTHQEGGAVQSKGKAFFDRGKTATSERDRTGEKKDKIVFDKDKFSSPEKAVRQNFDKEKSSYKPSYSKGGGKSEPPFVKPRIKKELPIDIPFIPIEPIDKDDIKSKRKKDKDKVKKKKWSDDEDLSDNLKIAQKKRKSVVEGKDLYEQEFSAKKLRKKDSKNKQRPKVQQKTQITVPKAIKRRIKIDDTIELSELAKRMSIKANEMIQKLMGMGVMVTVNQTIDFDTATLVAAEFDYEVEKAAVAEDMLSHANEADNPENLTLRPPVVTIMGHVDHGKTSLLDVIRKSKITTGEAGGITQHIGAYSVQTPKGGIVTFLDTPGHAAFTSMRSRGAKITDIVVLVVAADDGVMPQTVEAINHSKAAAVPVLVAVNKMDKTNADPEKVMRELADHGLLSEEWGGDVIFAKVSAKKKQGIDELLDLILLQAEVLELKANPDRLAKGHVVEARLDAGRGPVATVLVQQGTLKTGQPVVCGLHSGKIRIMSDDMGKNIESAGPSTPVEIVGLSGVPEAGDEFIALESEKDAKNISESRMQKERAKELAKKSRANLEKLFANMGADQVKQLKLIIKADVHGSLEAINESLIKLSQEEVDVKIVHSGTGAINESDVSLAAVSDAIIIGFNVRPTPKVREMAKEENVDMRFYDIIYNVINDIKMALTGLMPSTFHEIIIGRAEVRDTFVIPAKGTIAGCFVVDGKVSRGEKIRLLRDGVIKCDSTLSSLRRFKDDAKEVTQGYECGIGIEKFNDIKVGDIIECYQVEERKASIDSLKETTILPQKQ